MSLYPDWIGSNAAQRMPCIVAEAMDFSLESVSVELETHNSVELDLKKPGMSVSLKNNELHFDLREETNQLDLENRLLMETP